MTQNPKRISRDKYVLEALEEMEKYNITVMPVVEDDNKVIGLVHIHDILKSGAI